MAVAEFEDSLAAASRGATTLVGVGCTGRRDDGAGVVLARRVMSRAEALLRRRPQAAVMRVIDAGDRPEDLTADIVAGDPDTILIADAVDIGGEAGDVALLQASQLPTGGIETHRASLRALMEYLAWRSGARVLLLAVQPAVIDDGPELTPAIARTIEQVARILEAEGAS